MCAWYIRRTLLAVMFMVVLLGISMSSWALNHVDAAVGNGSPASLQEYWNGEAEWVFQKKETWSSTGTAGYFNGGHVEVAPDGTWYYFNRKYVSGADASCSIAKLGIQVRKSLDKGQTWSAPVDMIMPTAGTAWSCIATDGDAWYNEGEDKWVYLFQCQDNNSWKGCLAERAGADPMGAFTAAASNPVIEAGDLWNPICNTMADKCASLAGGTGKVFDEGTFNIFRHDGTYYWVGFHGYDGVRGYRGIAKTTDFVTWIAGDPGQGVPGDAVFTSDDTQLWRESWDGGTSTGGGQGSMFYEDGYYYHLIEGSDKNLACTDNQRWNYGLYRSSSLASTSWDPFPAGNPVIYSSLTPEGPGGSVVPCNVQYAGLFKDPDTNYMYLYYGRSSHVDANTDGLYWFRLEQSDNLLVNSDLWRSDDYGWNRTGSGTNMAVYRFPGNTPDGTPYLAANCGGACGSNHSIYQDVAVTGSAGTTVSFGGSFMSEGGSAALDVVVYQMDAAYNVLRADTLPITTGTSWASYSHHVPLHSGVVKLRYQFYMKNPVTYRSDDHFVSIH